MFPKRRLSSLFILLTWRVVGSECGDQQSPTNIGIDLCPINQRSNDMVGIRHDGLNVNSAMSSLLVCQFSQQGRGRSCRRTATTASARVGGYCIWMLDGVIS